MKIKLRKQQDFILILITVMMLRKLIVKVTSQTSNKTNNKIRFNDTNKKNTE